MQQHRPSYQCPATATLVEAGIRLVRSITDRAEREGWDNTERHQQVQIQRQAEMRAVFPDAAQQEFMEAAGRHSCGETEECDAAEASAAGLIKELVEKQGRDLALAIEGEEACRAALAKQEATLAVASEQATSCDAAVRDAHRAASDAAAQLEVASKLADERAADASVAETDVANAESVVDIADRLERGRHAAAIEAEAQCERAQADELAAASRVDAAVAALEAAKGEHALANASVQQAIANVTSSEGVLAEATRAQIASVAACNTAVDEASDQLTHETQTTLALEVKWQDDSHAAAQSNRDVAAALSQLQRDEASLTAQHTAAVYAQLHSDEATNAAARSTAQLGASNAEMVDAEREVAALRDLFVSTQALNAEIRALESQQLADVAAIALHNSRTNTLEQWVALAENTVSSMQRDYDNCRNHLFALGNEASMTAQQVYYHGRHQMNAVRGHQATWRQSIADHTTSARGLQDRVDRRNARLQQLKTQHAHQQLQYTQRSPKANQRLSAATVAQQTAARNHDRDAALKLAASQRLAAATTAHDAANVRHEHATTRHREAVSRQVSDAHRELESRGVLDRAKQQLNRAHYALQSAQQYRDDVVLRSHETVAAASTTLRDAQATLRASEYEREYRYGNVETSRQALNSATEVHLSKRHAFQVAQTLHENAKREHKEAGMRLSDMENKLLDARNRLTQAQSALADAKDVNTICAKVLAQNSAQLESARAALTTATNAVSNARVLCAQKAVERQVAEENERDIAAQLADAHQSLEVVQERRRVTQEMLAARQRPVFAHMLAKGIPQQVAHR
jgi:trimeric autotransporter adhesin